MRTVKNIADALAAKVSQEGAHLSFEIQPIPGEVDVLLITYTGREELPIYLSVADTQILCIAHLWSEKEVKPEKRTRMMELMLEMNIPIPLSAFAKMGDRFVLFGSMPVTTPLDDIILELEVLSDNTLEVIDLMREYLV